MSGESPEDDVRRRSNKILDEMITDEKYREVLETVLAVTKQARGWCPNCKKAVMVEINDSKAVVSALAELMNQAKGRPEQAQSENDEKITLIRREYV